MFSVITVLSITIPRCIVGGIYLIDSKRGFMPAFYGCGSEEMLVECNVCGCEAVFEGGFDDCFRSAEFNGWDITPDGSTSICKKCK